MGFTTRIYYCRDAPTLSRYALEAGLCRLLLELEERTGIDGIRVNHIADSGIEVDFGETPVDVVVDSLDEISRDIINNFRIPILNINDKFPDMRKMKATYGEYAKFAIEMIKSNPNIVREMIPIKVTKSGGKIKEYYGYHESIKMNRYFKATYFLSAERMDIRDVGAGMYSKIKATPYLSPLHYILFLAGLLDISIYNPRFLVIVMPLTSNMRAIAEEFLLKLNTNYFENLRDVYVSYIDVISKIGPSLADDSRFRVLAETGRPNSIINAVLLKIGNLIPDKIIGSDIWVLRYDKSRKMLLTVGRRIGRNHWLGRVRGISGAVHELYLTLVDLDRGADPEPLRLLDDFAMNPDYAKMMRFMRVVYSSNILATPAKRRIASLVMNITYVLGW